MKNKKCYTCKKEKSVSEFSKCSKHKDGLTSNCKSCVRIYNANYRKKNHKELLRKKREYFHSPEGQATRAAYREVNLEKIYAAHKEWEANNVEYRKAYWKVQSKKYRKANKEQITAKKKEYYDANREELIKKSRKWVESNPAQAKETQRKNYKKTKKERKAYSQLPEVIERRNKRRKEIYHNDPARRLITSYRNGIRRGFKQIINGKKDIASLACLGCSWEEFLDHIESQFYNRQKTGEKMTFDNHSVEGWHLDHVIPISRVKTKEDIIMLSHYTNLQPLWAEDNHRKNDT